MSTAVERATHMQGNAGSSPTADHYEELIVLFSKWCKIEYYAAINLNLFWHLLLEWKFNENVIKEELTNHKHLAPRRQAVTAQKSQ